MNRTPHAISMAFLLLGLSASAHSKRAMPMTGTIPDDDREVAGPRDSTGAAPLKRFEHRPWTSGSSVAFLPGEKLAVIADTDNDAVVVIDVLSGVVQHRVAVGRRPERLVLAPDGRVFVTNRGSRTVSVVDPRRGVETRTVDAGVEPLGLALTPTADTLLVASSATGDLIAYDAVTLAQRFRLHLAEPWPAAVAAHPDGRRVFVTHFHGATVDVVDLERQKVTGSLTLPSNDTGLPGRLMGRGQRPRTPNMAAAAVVSPGGTRLFVAHVMADTGSNRPAVAAGGYGVGAEAPIVATVATFDLATGQLVRPKVEFDHRGFGNAFQADLQAQSMAQPIALAHDPGHSRLLFVGMGSDKVLDLDATASDPITRPVGALATAQAPKGVAISRDGTVIVHSSHSYDLGVYGVTTGTWAAKATRHFEFAKSPLPADAARGRRLFTFALDNRIGGNTRFGCASCHPDGRQDGLVWRIGAGPRQTPILADRVEATAPFNWLGTEHRLQDNIKQTVHRLGGTGIADQDCEDLAVYMTRYMPGVDNPHRGTNVAEGKRLFESAEVGCSGCHQPGARFTDGGLHDVGTTTALEVQVWQTKNSQPAAPGAEPLPKPPIAYNTPSLRHLHASAPYYHDGSAKTLRELLTTGNAGDRMGRTSQLSAAQIDALAAYLQTL